MINHRLNAVGQKKEKLGLSQKKLVIGEGQENIIIVFKYFDRYYTGDLKDEGKENRLSLEDAAKKVQISKKSLDDYLLQIR